MHLAPAKPKPSNAFTLIDLLVMVTVLAVMAVMLPAFAGARPNARSLQCLNNLRQLTAAWIMYAYDYSDRLPNNFTVNETQAQIASLTYRTWACDVMDWTSNSQNTNKILLTKSLLAPYLAANSEIYRCPDDTYQSSVQRSLKWPPRVRSYSMNGFFGNNGTSGSSGNNPFFPSYRQWLKLADVQQPARVFALIEEHPDSINEGLFVENPAGAAHWQDIPTSYHAGACGISFADGRAEVHKWLSWTSKIPIIYTYNPPGFDAAGRTDFQWLLDRMAVLY